MKGELSIVYARPDTIMSASSVNWVLLSTFVTRAVAPDAWFTTWSPLVTVLVKFWPDWINLFVAVPVVVPESASPPPLARVGLFVEAFHVPINLRPPAKVLIWLCAFPNACKIESLAKMFEAVGDAKPVSTFPVTESLSNVTAPDTFELPSKLLIVAVAWPVREMSLAVCSAVADAEFTLIELGRFNCNCWLLAVVSIWLAVPITLNVWVLSVTSPVPVSPEKSKSEALSKLFT